MSPEYDQVGGAVAAKMHAARSMSGLAAGKMMNYAPNVPKRTTVNDTMERCNRLLNELAAQEQRVLMIADRLEGPSPTAAEKAYGDTLQPQACLVGSVEFVAVNLERLIGKISAQLHRIEDVLG